MSERVNSDRSIPEPRRGELDQRVPPGVPRVQADAVTQRVERVPAPIPLHQTREATTVNIMAPTGTADQPVAPAYRPPYRVTYPRSHPADRVVKLIWYALTVLEVVLAIRVALKLIGANQANAFASFVNATTAPIVSPFLGLIGSPRLGASVFELDTLVAMIVIILVGYALVRLVELVSNY
jgi:hypothetical protein